MKRFFTAEKLGKDFELTGTEYNHLANVLRISAGEEVIICCGDEFDYIYSVRVISKKSASLKFVGKEINTHNPKAKLTVFMALVKTDNLSLAVQKLNEIGVSEIVLFSAARSNTSQSAVKIEKLRDTARQSCKQCGRSIPVAVRFGTLGELSQAQNEHSQFDTVFFADETTVNTSAVSEMAFANLSEENTSRIARGSEHAISITPISSAVPSANYPADIPANPQSLTISARAVDAPVNAVCDSLYLSEKRVALVIGAEGGFTAPERSFLNGLANASAVSFGRRILRAETCAIAACAIILSKMSEI